MPVWCCFQKRSSFSFTVANITSYGVLDPFGEFPKSAFNPIYKSLFAHIPVVHCEENLTVRSGKLFNRQSCPSISVPKTCVRYRGRFCLRVRKTLGRLREDFGKTLGKLWEDFRKTLGSIPQARERSWTEISGSFGRGIPGNPLGFPHRMCQSSG